ncbi:hypothetical protein L1889_07490 [Paenalcaligenes niemegkensis]|uniref:hypothetical protein n=1 Tax=Paenalcaligenes niemegkensis TaxID=2895469 RepID=UPI001EE8621F|nr:hypothetical protein [Paenalcaligenes niemegkensis]MCQ9616569.1 hypothetical protein [Paenalcaligenes niemegkensis]
MQIVLSGALPDPHQARELLSHLEQKAPTLVRWLQHSDCQLQQTIPTETRCTALEVWQLKQAGFVMQPAQHLSAGLGPLLVKNQKAEATEDNERVWLAELVHIAPSRDGAALISGDLLDISISESTELLESSLQWFAGTGFNAGFDSATRWRLSVPEDFNADTASTRLVSQGMVNDWWEQDIHTRPWRRLVNEFQMLWFDHPVNTVREQAGKPAINSLWLMGGASRGQFDNLDSKPRYQLYTDLENSAQQQDWGQWLEELANLERNVFAPNAHNPAPELVLCGVERYMQCNASRPTLRQRLFGSPKNNWRKMWSPL